MTNEYETNSRFVTNRRNLLGAGVVGLAAVLGLSATAAAQDQIVSTKQGEIPTTGGQRPGPIGPEPEVPEIQGVLPVSIAIAKINLNAQVETIQIAKHDHPGLAAAYAAVSVAVGMAFAVAGSVYARRKAYG